MHNFNCDHELVVLGKGERIIKNGAYRGRLDLICVQIADGVTYIDDCAFDGCRYLSVIIIPASVERISETAFKGCENIFWQIIYSRSVEFIWQSASPPYCNRDWCEMSLECWVWLLREHPFFVNHFPAEDWRYLTSEDWVNLLTKQPGFSIECDRYNGWELIDCDLSVWVELLGSQPSLSEYARKFKVWERFSGLEWSRLLKSQACFYRECSENDGWKKIHEDVVKAKKDAFIRSQDTTFYYDGWDAPELGDVDYGLDERGWLVLSKNAELFWRYSEQLGKEFWLTFLLDYPREAAFWCQFCGVWNKLDKGDFEFLLNSGDQFFDKMTTSGSLGFWKRLYQIAPEIVNKLVKIASEEHEWRSFLPYVYMLNPLYVSNCAAEPKMSGDDWNLILNFSPRFFEEVGHIMCGKLWVSLIMRAHCRAVDRCDEYKGWAKLTTSDWKRLFRCRDVGTMKKMHDVDYYIDYCADKGQEGMEEEEEITKRLEGLFDVFIDRCDMHSVWGRFNLQDWVELLSADIRLSEKCKTMQELQGPDWCVILQEQPKMGNACDAVEGWRKFRKQDWMELLLVRKEFLCKSLQYGAEHGWQSMEEVEASVRRYEKEMD